MESLEDALLPQMFQDYPAFFTIKLPIPVYNVSLDIHLSTTNVLRMPVPLVNTEDTAHAFLTQPDVRSTMTSPNVPSVQPDTILTMEFVTESPLIVLEELISNDLLGLVTRSMINVRNGAPQLVFVPAALVLLKKPSMVNAFHWRKLAVQDNMLMLLLIVLMLILFARPLKKLVEDVSNVFGVMNITLLKENASKLSVQPDSFPTILENVLKSAIFAIYSISEEIVWLVSQHTPSQVMEPVFNFKNHAHALKDNTWVMTITAKKSANSVISSVKKLDSVPNVLIAISSCTPENVSLKNNVERDKFLLTTTVMTSAQVAETLTDKPENVSIVFLKTLNFIMGFVSQRKPVA